ncbi:MAG: hypothetical protein KY456_00580 [Chloroflexi bacterium]|nr:hypothetical protein [Chloroflexota bacterium]
MRNGPETVLVVVVFVVAALAGSGVLNPTTTLIADAQSEPVTTVTGIQLPPQVPGLDYTTVDTGDADLIEGLVIPDTPIAPILPGDTTTGLDVPDTSGALTTSLGGSDVTVSSVGGSYEVDAPKKRSHRKK